MYLETIKKIFLSFWLLTQSVKVISWYSLVKLWLSCTKFSVKITEKTISAEWSFVKQKWEKIINIIYLRLFCSLHSMSYIIAPLCGIGLNIINFSHIQFVSDKRGRYFGK